MSNISHLTPKELFSYPGQTEESGSNGKKRYYCPLHGGDHQHSLEVDPETGHFTCFQCGAWGYIKGYVPMNDHNSVTSYIRPPRSPTTATDQPAYPEGFLEEALNKYQHALPGSIGEEYLKLRGISLETAQKYGIGYSPHNSWVGRKSWASNIQRRGRIVFPHTDIQGSIINLYGRALGKDEFLAKGDRHDHGKGPKCIFNAGALLKDVVYVTEGAFDAISLLSAGYDSCAIFGLNGMRWDWCNASKVVLCLDFDAAGQAAMKKLAFKGWLYGKKVFFVPKELSHDCKDFNELWRIHGAIDLGDWIEQKNSPVGDKILLQEKFILNSNYIEESNEQKFQKDFSVVTIDACNLSHDITVNGIQIF